MDLPARRCGFANLQHIPCCLKCGGPRPENDAEPPTFAMRQWASGEPRPHVRTRGLELGGIQGVEGDESAKMICALYPHRLAWPGFIQSISPLVAGEKFSVTIHSLGSFGEIGVGLGSLRNPESKKDSTLLGSESMIGWGAQEIGCHGDHGRCYVRGKPPRQQASSPWDETDVIECGLTTLGSAYIVRNGELVAEVPGYWSIEQAYPTVTMYSGGAQIAMNLADVEEKPVNELGERIPGKSAGELLASLKRTVIKESQRKLEPGLVPGNFLNRWLGLWCSCENMQMNEDTSVITTQ